MKFVLTTFLLFSFTSCALLNAREGKLGVQDNSYTQVESGGTFISQVKSGFDKQRRYIIKTKVFEGGNEKQFLERAITISKISNINSTTKALIPHQSESVIFLDSKKYSSRTLYTKETRELVIKMVSPERQWNGQRSVTIPKGNGNVCFYQSVIECAKVTGFINMAIDKEMGSMNFYMIWEGFPYFHEHFINIPSVPFSRSSLSYDGKNRDGLYRFTLEAAGQSQFYFLDKNLKLVKHIWSSQGFLREIR